MPYIDPLQMPPQRGPNSARAVQAESNQAKAELEEVKQASKANSIPHRANVGARKPFLNKISIAKWKMAPEDIYKKLLGTD